MRQPHRMDASVVHRVLHLEQCHLLVTTWSEYCEFTGAVTIYPQAQVSVPSGRDLRIGNSRATRLAHLRSELL
jgi:hypothetical protein